MAKAQLNGALEKLQGKVGGWVFRQQNGQTVVLPHTETEDKPSAAQLARRELFQRAQLYAAAILADPLKRAWYQRLGVERKRPPNALLISNFLTPPVVELVELASYHRQSGGEIRVVATDGIEITGVTVSIHGSGGAPLENGPATKDHGIWTYATTTTPSAGQPLSIKVVARNRAGTEGTISVALP